MHMMLHNSSSILVMLVVELVLYTVERSQYSTDGVHSIHRDDDLIPTKCPGPCRLLANNRRRGCVCVKSSNFSNLTFLGATGIYARAV